jgi:small subunit ribosomal protein S20
VAHSLSSKKRIRQNETRRALNRARRSVLRSQLRESLEAVQGADAAAAERQFREACQLLDREADRGLIHRNAAARRKSRLAKRLNALKARAGA